MLTTVFDAARSLVGAYRRYRDENTVLVYQMGKVGSTAIASALGDRAVQIHNFYPANEPCSCRPLYANALYRKPFHWLFYRAIRMAVRRRKTLKIITLVRDPIERNISMYFHDLHYWLAYYFSAVRPDRVRSEGLDTLIDCFRTTFAHRYPLDWFDRELKRLTGIDVYDHAFDTAAGFTRIEQGGTSVLLVQTEQLWASWHAVEEFVGRKLELRETNRGRHKWYGPLYARFLRAYSATASELEEMYSSRYARLFFSEDARARMRRRWQTPRSTAGASTNVRRAG
jgi:hypothetical protein